MPPTPPVMEPPTPPSRDTVAALRKKKARQRLVIIAVAVVILAGALWYFQKSLSLPLQSLDPFGNSPAPASTSSQPTQNFSAPSPIQQATKVVPKKTNTLTPAGVIAQTNAARAANGDLPSLAENATLDDIATLRLDDMFTQQYFAHIGPQGESAISVASSVGYNHLALGENLALGNYAGDAGVVTAWMGSPGHRANILDTHYTQIGVAVREGMFEGQETWLAVQVFGRPSSDCTAPDANLENSINHFRAADRAPPPPSSPTIRPPSTRCPRNPVLHTTRRWRITIISPRNTTPSLRRPRPPSAFTMRKWMRSTRALPNRKMKRCHAERSSAWRRDTASFFCYHCGVC